MEDRCDNLVREVVARHSDQLILSKAHRAITWAAVRRLPPHLSAVIECLYGRHRVSEPALARSLVAAGEFADQSQAIAAIRRGQGEAFDLLKGDLLPLFAETLVNGDHGDEGVLRCLLQVLTPGNDLNAFNRPLVVAVYHGLGPDQRRSLLQSPEDSSGHRQTLQALRKKIRRWPRLEDRCELLMPAPKPIRNLTGLGYALTFVNLAHVAPNPALARRLSEALLPQRRLPVAALWAKFVLEADTPQPPLSNSVLAGILGTVMREAAFALDQGLLLLHTEMTRPQRGRSHLFALDGHEIHAAAV